MPWCTYPLRGKPEELLLARYYKFRGPQKSAFDFTVGKIRNSIPRRFGVLHGARAGGLYGTVLAQNFLNACVGNFIERAIFEYGFYQYSFVWFTKLKRVDHRHRDFT